jgi:hypothetical protein
MAHLSISFDNFLREAIPGPSGARNLAAGHGFSSVTGPLDEAANFDAR